MRNAIDLIADLWGRLMTFGRRVRVIYFDRTPKKFRDTLLMPGRRRRDR